MRQDFLRQSEAARQYLSRIGLGHIRDSIKTRYKLVPRSSLRPRPRARALRVVPWYHGTYGTVGTVFTTYYRK